MGKRKAELQALVNQQARLVTGCFRSTNQGELMLESGLRPVASLLNKIRHETRNTPGRRSGRRAGRRPQRTWHTAHHMDRNHRITGSDRRMRGRGARHRSGDGGGQGGGWNPATRVRHVHGRVKTRQRRLWVCGCLEARQSVEGPESSHGLHPGSVRR